MVRFTRATLAIFLMASADAFRLRGVVDNVPTASEELILAVEDLQEKQGSRHLQQDTDFQPLACNSAVDSATCGSFSTLIGHSPGDIFDPTIHSSSDPLVVPCGSCFAMDVTGTVDLPGGLNVIGKLDFPPDSDVTIRTPHVFVEGVLKITNTKPVTPTNKSVQFILTGTTDEFLIPHSDQNANACPATGCKVGKKAFAVAGGRLDINAIDDQCPTWVKIKDLAAASSPVLPAGSYPVRPAPLDGCSFTLFDHTFSTENGIQRWTGNDGALIDIVDNEGLVVHGRTRTFQGPWFDLAYVRPCIVSGVTYIFTARMKFKQTSPTAMPGTPTDCKASGQNCPRLVTRVRKPDNKDSTKWVWRLSQRSAPDYDEWFTVAATITYDEIEVDPGVVFSLLYLEGLEGGVDVVMKDAKFEIPSQASYPSPIRPCSNLLQNGDANANGLHPYPFKPGDSNMMLSIEEELVDGAINKFFRLKGRVNTWNGISQVLNSPCLTPNAAFEFRGRFRVHSDTPQRVQARMSYLKEDGSGYSYPMIYNCGNIGNEWTECVGTFVFTDAIAAGSKHKFYTDVQDPTVVVDFDDLYFGFNFGPGEDLVVDGAVASCWETGSEVVITPHTTDYMSSQVRTIDTIRLRDDETAIMNFTETIITPVTELESLDFATEIALLSRNVGVKGDDDGDGNGLHGAHLIVMNTPNVIQTLVGVEFQNVGQQGVLGRYPIHMHMNAEMDGTKLAKNTIRDSKQRCVVIHASHKVVIEQNVAFNTFGHCFMLEDGVEQNNKFLSNLGAQTKKATLLVKPGETDASRPSTFWITHPNNDFIGNVAAGSQDSGYWFELRRDARSDASRAIYGKVDAVTTEMALFVSNVAHSNYVHGLRSYPDGYRPPSEARFENHKSFKNRRDGIFFHNSHNLSVYGGIFADNRVGLDIDRADNSVIDGVTVVGMTEGYRNLISAQNAPYFCPSSDPIIGLRIHTYPFSASNDGVTVRDAQFSNFDGNDDCPRSAAVNFNDEVQMNHFTFTSSFSDINIIDGRGADGIMDMCSAAVMDVKDVLIADLDSSMNPDSTSTYVGPSVFVSNEPPMTSFSSSCVEYASSCFAYCTECMRSVTIYAEPSTSAYFKLRVDDGAGTVVDVPGNFLDDEYQYASKEATKYTRFRSFTFAIPAGVSVTAEFIDTTTGSPAWPLEVEEVWSDVQCSGGPTPDALTLNKPTVDNSQCAELISNTDFESGYINPWKHGGSGVELLPTGGVDGSNAIRSSDRTSPWFALGYFLDQSCLELNVDEVYEFKALYKLVDSNGNPGTCDPHNSHQSYSCPSMTVVLRDYNDPVEKKGPMVRSYIGGFASTVQGYQEDGWSVIHGYLSISPRMVSAQSATLYFDRFSSSLDIIIDNVSLTRFDESTHICPNNLVENGDFSSGTLEWKVFGSGKLEVTSEGALKMFSRASSHSSPMQELVPSCFVEGERYRYKAKFQVLTAGTDNVVVCDPFTSGSERCPSSGLKIIQSSSCTENCGDSYVTISLASVPVNPNGWTDTAWIFKTTPAMFTEDNKIQLYSTFDAQYDYLLDDVIIEHVPMDCTSNLIENPSMVGGSGLYWTNERGDRSRLAIYSPGASDNWAMRSYDRTSAWHGPQLSLDDRCVVENEVWTISAQVRLLDSNGAGVDCDFTKKYGSTENCLSMYISGEKCGTNNDEYHSIRLFHSVDVWDKDIYNTWHQDYTVDSTLITCDVVKLLIRDVNTAWDIVVDDLSVTINGI